MFFLIFFVLTAIVLLIFQTTIFPLFSVAGVQPDLVLLATVGYSLVAGRQRGLSFGFFLGLLQDVLSGGLLGTNGFIKGFVGYVVGVFRQQVADRSFFFPSLAIFFGSLLNGALYFLIARVLYADKYSWWFFVRTTTLETTYNLVLGLVVTGAVGVACQRKTGLVNKLLKKVTVLISDRV
ncbi:MAG: rod shape-determining protein MreD [Candidatus Tectomicrobia bacterium]|uniref:Rod shape-determining protein MreD n=1 Tax=Tectimicrobiota bacterium TaxID=2528274 RepID=A0A932GQS8_UNCTE|nr:rod shape-determining protein MreD [Candidatus Tectomicrobia bacterium]